MSLAVCTILYLWAHGFCKYTKLTSKISHWIQNRWEKKNPFLPSQPVRLDYTCMCLDWATCPSKSRPILGIRPSITFGPKRNVASLIGLYCCGPLLLASNTSPMKELLILTVQQLHSVYDLRNSPPSTKSIMVLGLWVVD